ncbi:hypothetical protein E4U15_004195 [Claviceps sp. LM218 group G6]|nr:hypothetical protein E4U15_004195 [Claviceps sp. LM218 group G6]
MPDSGYTPPTPLATQLATATPDANGHILLTLKRRQYVLQSGDSYIQHDTPAQPSGHWFVHPALGINYLRAQWMEDEDRIPPAQNRLSTYWNKWYRHCVTDGPGSAAEYSIASLGLNVDFKKWLSDRTTGRSETDRYYDLPFSLLNQGHQDSIQWWLQKREEFLDLLAVPAMAGECEKAFNAAEVTMLHSTAQWYLGLWRKLSAYAIGFTGERLRWPASRILTQKQPPHLRPKRGSRINSQDVRSSEGCSQKKVALNLITFRIA